MDPGSGKVAEGTLRSPQSWLARAFPRGQSLPTEWWERRHTWMVRLLSLLSVALVLFTYVGSSYDAGHTLLHGLAPGFFAVIAAHRRLGRRLRSAAASLGLLTWAAVLVHATHGLTEAHFSFFVLIGLMTLYEDWLPFGLAVGFVVVHHGLGGALDHSAVYDHPGDPWKWAVIHAGFVAAAGAVGISTWQHNEELRQQKEESEAEVRRRQADVLAVSRLAGALATESDAREHICKAVLDLTDATFAMLWELEEQGTLRNTAAAGIDIPAGSKINVGSESSVAGIAVIKKQRQFVGNVSANPAVSSAIRATGARAAVYEPVMRGDRCIGVLIAAWDHEVEIESSRDASLILLLANEAAFAIDRSDLLGRLHHLARHDPLTGLANRRAWEERLSQELSPATRQGTSLCVALIDLDHFKKVNDTKGHQAGDRLLRSLAAAWPEVLRDTDFLGRLGGDEFGLILPRCDFREAEEVLTRIERALPDVAWSAGLATFLPGESLDDLVRRADAALYRAKAAGRTHTTLAHA